ncbi:alpha/beta hydrolase [Streptomyces sp. MMG1121]|uniref:alpha/beta hydrolase n=1 Tax=Streptomyces sp. MMG1121 TaxID=1415544 RepID=UPI0006B067EA|nr:alpha/beta hydrolase [Streptomyces sp. MMG1121]KOV67511.1 alpha/beta hydrolase [Streptomyces sp. MMG1121]
MAQRIPRFSLEGVADAEASHHPFTTEDGLSLSLTRFRRARGAPLADPVLLVHGLTSASDLFIMPEHRNLTSYLLDHGFTDVWAIDSRMSNRFPYNTEPGRQSLDDLARFDYPAALAELRRHAGPRPVHVIAHCLGSVAFAMSLSAGTVDGIASFVANSVALTPRLTAGPRWKLEYGPELLEHVLGLSVLDPRARTGRRFTPGRALSRLVSLVHQECDNPACHMISFMWGCGWPALYSHENLHPVTHERIADLLGPSGLSYLRHVRKMVRAGHAVKDDPRDPRHASLPDDYLTDAPGIGTPILFLAGDRNHVFGDSNVICHRELSAHAPDRHALAVLPGYGHLDPIIGKDADRDVFPRILDFLRLRAAA